MFKFKKDVEISDFQKEQKKRERKEKINRQLNKIKNVLYQNKEMIVFFGPMVIGGTTWLIRTVNRHVTMNKEKDLKELYCYDRSLGHYWRLKRNLTNSEWVSIDKRKQNGERLADILDELRVLK